MSKHAQVLSELSFMQLEEEKEPVAFKKIKELKEQRKEYEARFMEAKEAAKKVMEGAVAEELARVQNLTKEELLAELKLREPAEEKWRCFYGDTEELVNARRAAPPPPPAPALAPAPVPAPAQTSRGSRSWPRSRRKS